MELLSRSHGGLGPAAADLDSCVLIQSEQAQGAAAQPDGAGHESKARRVCVYLLSEQRGCSFHPS